MEELNKFYYLYSSDVSSRIEIKIGSLEGKRTKPTYNDLLKDPLLRFSGLCLDEFSDLMVECQIFDKGEPLSLPVTTEYKAFTIRWNWNEWLLLPSEYCDLPRTAQLAITIYDCAGPDKLLPVGGTTVSLFSKHGVFREGMLDLRVWPNVVADGNHPTTTPGKGNDGKDHSNDQMWKLSKLAKKHRNGHIPKVDWLDRLTFRELEVINEKEKRASEYMYLTVEFPKIYFDGILHHIVYFEQNGEELLYLPKSIPDMVLVPDSELGKENIVERKHHMLARSLRCGNNDKDAKPNATVRDILNTIVSYPPSQQLSIEEQDYVWKFRFYLSTQKKALTKFLKCVKWNHEDEVGQALHMMDIWQPMDVEDALELLGSSFTHPVVRTYAILRLQQAPDEEILLYLLQLVQALKYEDEKSIEEGYERISTGQETILFPLSEDNVGLLEKKDSRESNSTLTGEQRSSSYNQADQLAASNVNSIIEVEGERPMQSTQSLPSNVQNICTESANTDTLQSHMYEEDGNIHDLASFLVYRACKNFTLANYFYWYLLLECEDQESSVKQDEKVRNMYVKVMKTFVKNLAGGTETMQKKRTILFKQQKFIGKLVELMKAVSRENANRTKKIIKLKQLLSDPDAFKYNFSKIDPIPLPVDPEVLITGIIPEKAGLFKSSMMPAKLHFKTVDDKEYVAIFKLGDDLRQDQLILQMITLMDKLLNKENLDLKLTPYRVLATSTKHGFVQFIESVTVAEGVPSSEMLNCKTVDDKKYVAIFPLSDDLMQEQLILQMITLKDKLSNKENVGFKLTPYGVLATRTKYGFVQFIASVTMTEVLALEGSIQNYFRKEHPQETGPYNIQPDIMDAYVRSCAGYCVITYLLGVGDRHLDNLLLTHDGKLFHIDFGYILGRDPKPMPPPMKLSKEMVEAMGGMHSEHYQEFRKLCYTAFLHLRRHANLMLNLFSLMIDASVPDIALEPDKAVKKVQDKLMLNLGEEEAVQYIQNLIDLSVTAVMPAIVEHLHKFTQYIRK